MSCRAGFVWGTKQHFNRNIEECDIACESGHPADARGPVLPGYPFHCLIIPTGFANPAYSNLLPALRAASTRIKKFVEKGEISLFLVLPLKGRMPMTGSLFPLSTVMNATRGR